jgi:hypothetical protein
MVLGKVLDGPPALAIQLQHLFVRGEVRVRVRGGGIE